MDDLILAILVGLAIASIRIRDLLGAVAVLGAYSLVMAILWCRMNAVDVAFTEAAVGAGISTVLMVSAVSRVGRRTRPHPVVRPGIVPRGVTKAGALLAVIATAAGLLYAVPDMPVVGDPTAPATTHPLVERWYIEVSPDVPGHPDEAAYAVWWIEMDGEAPWAYLDGALEVRGQRGGFPLGRLVAADGRHARLGESTLVDEAQRFFGDSLPDVEIVLRDETGRAQYRGVLPALQVANQGELDIPEGLTDLAFVGELPPGDTPPRARAGMRRRGVAGEVGPANVVTSVLGDYRGYDTLGETVVIFTAGLCVVALLREAQFALRRKDEDLELEGDAS